MLSDTDPTTIRLPRDLLDDLDAEAEESGFSSRAEYIRQILFNRESISQEQLVNIGQAETASSQSYESLQEDIRKLESQIATMTDRMGELEKEMKRIQSEVKSGEENVIESDSNETSKSSHGSPVSNQESAGGDASDEKSNETDDTIFRNIDIWLQERGPQSDEARQVVLSAVRILDDQGPLKAGELKDQLFDQHSNAYTSAKTLWTSTIERLYEDIPGLEKVDYGTYTFDRESAERAFDSSDQGSIESFVQ